MVLFHSETDDKETSQALLASIYFPEVGEEVTLRTCMAVGRVALMVALVIRVLLLEGHKPWTQLWLALSVPVGWGKPFVVPYSVS